MCQRFICSQKRNSVGFDKKRKVSPHTPIVKNRQPRQRHIYYEKCPLLQRHVYRYNVAEMGDFYNGGQWGNYVFCRILLVFRFLVHKKKITHTEYSLINAPVGVIFCQTVPLIEVRQQCK